MKEIKITIYNLILMIIILMSIILLCSFSIVNVKRKLELKNYILDMERIQEKVNLIRKEYTVWEEYDGNEAGNFLAYIQSLGYINANTTSNMYVQEFSNIINNLNNENTEYWNSATDSILSNYCYFSKESLKQNFKISNPESEVIINFYTGNVISRAGVKDIRNGIIHRQYDSEIGNKLATSIFVTELKTIAEIVENYGLLQRVKVSFNKSENAPNILDAFYYNDEKETKKNCSEFQDYIYIRDENAIYFTVNISGKYFFVIEDSNYIEYPGVELDINLCNKPILEENMIPIYWDENGNEQKLEDENNPNWYNYSVSKLRFANSKTQDGNYWVWIPRFIYNTLDGITNIEYAYEDTMKSTANKTLTGHKLQEAFDNNEYGFWISKFQANGELNEKISVIPSKTLTSLSTKDAILNINNYMPKATLMREYERQAILKLAEFSKIEISNDLVHYAGGGVKKEDYISNTDYSSTKNVYGVYDLITSENEITKNSNENEIGRYRLVIKSEF